MVTNVYQCLVVESFQQLADTRVDATGTIPATKKGKTSSVAAPQLTAPDLISTTTIVKPIFKEESEATVQRDLSTSATHENCTRQPSPSQKKADEEITKHRADDDTQEKQEEGGRSLISTHTSLIDIEACEESLQAESIESSSHTKDLQADSSSSSPAPEKEHDKRLLQIQLPCTVREAIVLAVRSTVREILVEELPLLVAKAVRTELDRAALGPRLIAAEEQSLSALQLAKSLETALSGIFQPSFLATMLRGINEPPQNVPHDAS